jgi:UDPglucose 6-dehydrogenase
MSLHKIGIVGHGYVGRATVHALSPVATARYADPAVRGAVPLTELVAWADALFVCVPTPQAADGRADLSVVHAVMAELVSSAARGPVVLKSTVPPGTTARLAREYRLPMVFHPEFLRERHHLADAENPKRVVLGWTEACVEAHRSGLRQLFSKRFPMVPLVELDSTGAELLKYASNALFGVKVSFANEMSELADRLGVAWEPLREALLLDPRIGDGHLQVPGPDGQRGFGGHCLPKDMSALRALAEQLEVPLDVVAAALSANQRRR